MAAGLVGTVLEFDESVGLGTVVGDDGRPWPFHCVSILDGSRSIRIGTHVEFDLGFCTLRREAVALRGRG